MEILSGRETASWMPLAGGRLRGRRLHGQTEEEGEEAAAAALEADGSLRQAMTPQEFATAYLPAARTAAAALGIPASAILAQWALESGWGTSHLAIEHHNLGGIKKVSSSTGGAYPADSGFAGYADVNGFTADYIRVLNLSLYANVRAAGQAPAASARERAENVITALAASPYDAAHYGGAATNVRACLAQLWPIVGEPDAPAPGPRSDGYDVTPAAGGGWTVTGPGLTAALVLGGVLIAAGLVKALKDSFDDPDFKDQAKKISLPLDYVSPEDMTTLAKVLLDRAKEYLK